MIVVPRMLSQRGITESTRSDSCYIKKANACRVKFFSTFFLIGQNIPDVSAFEESQSTLIKQCTLDIIFGYSK